MVQPMLNTEKKIQMSLQYIQKTHTDTQRRRNVFVITLKIYAFSRISPGGWVSQKKKQCWKAQKSSYSFITSVFFFFLQDLGGEKGWCLASKLSVLLCRHRSGECETEVWLKQRQQCICKHLFWLLFDSRRINYLSELRKLNLNY